MMASDTRALLEAAQLKAAEALPHDPLEAARRFREAFRHACSLGDRRHAAAQLAGMAISYSLLSRRRAAIRILMLAAKYAPDWETPRALLGTEYEDQARLELTNGHVSMAKLSFLAAASHFQCASELAMRAGIDVDAEQVKGNGERARRCRDRAAELPVG